jgi:hypothetical protein
MKRKKVQRANLKGKKIFESGEKFCCELIILGTD